MIKEKRNRNTIDVEMVEEGLVGVSGTVLLRPIDVFSLRGSLGAGQMKIGDFETLAVSLNAYIFVRDVHSRVEGG